MKRIRNSSVYRDYLPFFVGAAITLFVFLAIGRAEKSSYLYLFFYRSWQIQAVTTWLFASAILFVISRFLGLRDEEQRLKGEFNFPSGKSIGLEEAKQLMAVIPPEREKSLGARRMTELLRAYVNGEELIALNHDLSRREVEQVETGHLVLNALRQLIPVLGFLGTVVGLSMGMTRFPEISASGQNIEVLRNVLKDFAASLSVAFDTTLLALGYTVVVVLLAAILRSKEETFVAYVDQHARRLIAALIPMGPSADDAKLHSEFLRSFLADFRTETDKFLGEHLSQSFAQWQKGLIEGLHGSLQALALQNAALGTNLGQQLVESLTILHTQMKDMVQLSFDKLGSQAGEHSKEMTAALQATLAAFETRMAGVMQSAVDRQEQHTHKLAETFREDHGSLIESLGKLQQAVNSPPTYQVTVEPVPVRTTVGGRHRG